MSNTHSDSDYSNNGAEYQDRGWHVESVPGQSPKRISHVARLSATHPELAKQWHPLLNSKTPQDVTDSSTYNAWWLCEFGHKWKRQVNRRAVHGSGCPNCELQAASIAARYPDLAKCWSNKNDLEPGKVRASETASFWWTCPIADHPDFKAAVSVRVRTKNPVGCPTCAGRRLAIHQPPLSVTHPEIARQWHPVKNGDITADDVTAVSSHDIWWFCAKNPEHEWRQKVRRQLNHQCKFCKLQKNNLSLLEPDLALQWHPTKNGLLTPDMVSPGSKQRVLWQCNKFQSHVWEASVIERARKRRGCLFCANRLVDDRNSLASQSPQIAAEWHPTKNHPLTANSITYGSSKKVWWQCKTTKTHIWQAKVAQRTCALTGCPHCARVNDKNNLAILFPEVAAEWHPTKNGHLFPSWDPTSAARMLATGQKNRRLRPSDFAAKSNQTAWWQCKKSKLHVWSTAICHRTVGGTGCVFCANLKVAPDNSLAWKDKRLAKLWHPTRNLPLTPDQVTSGSRTVVWWRCFKSPLHVWQQSVSVVKRAYDTNHSGCPFCTSRKVGKDNHLAAKFPEVAQLWHPDRNGTLTPNSVLPFTKEKVWWQCPKASSHAWRGSVGTMVIRWKKTSRFCVFCSGYRIANEDCLATQHPELLSYWDKGKNLGISPKKIGCKASTQVYWRCPKVADHRWRLSVRLMVKRPQKCRFCSEQTK